jgi:hypothetical protein
MVFMIRKKAEAHLIRLGLTALLVISLNVTLWQGDAFAAGARSSGTQMSFSSPEEAARALAAAAKAHDVKALMAVLGPDGKQLISSGDDVADKNGRQHFVQLYEGKSKIVKEGDGRALLEVGENGWPFPIPIVKTAEGWRFDTAAGKKEILHRRIGKNELATIQACLSYVDAQREYASMDRGGDRSPEYAQKFVSEPGKKDGLYWEVKPGEKESPLGILFANARREGYEKSKSGNKPTPFHGYYFKILKAQGKNAPGGAFDYVVGGRMIGGFALLAYPAQYGSSGVMTFMVDHSGEVYEKDLGSKTSSTAQSIMSFDPDRSWRKVSPEHLKPLYGK